MSPDRLFEAAVRRLRLVCARLRFPRARFGIRCDIRRRLTLRIGSAGVLDVGAGCVLDKDMTIECEGKVIVGEGTIFGHHCTLASRSSIVIGRDCLIAELVSIRDHDHSFERSDIPIREQGFTVKPVTIGRNVWIAAKASIVKGVTIGDNAIVGANAVVCRDIPANAIAVGVPARVIRMRAGQP